MVCSPLLLPLHKCCVETMDVLRFPPAEDGLYTSSQTCYLPEQKHLFGFLGPRQNIMVGAYNYLKGIYAKSVYSYWAIGFHNLLTMTKWHAPPPTFFEMLRDSQDPTVLAAKELGCFVPHYVKLYFDVEYEVELNPALDCPAVLARFEEYVASVLRAEGLDWTVVILDASNASKVSRHYIYNMYKDGVVQMFYDTLACKTWIETKVAPGFPDDLCVTKTHAAKEFRGPVYDEGVYSRNRVFRLLGSAKAAIGRRTRVLVRVNPGVGTEEEEFRESLVTYQPP